MNCGFGDTCDLRNGPDFYLGICHYLTVHTVNVFLHGHFRRSVKVRVTFEALPPLTEFFSPLLHRAVGWDVLCLHHHHAFVDACQN